jgi:hypothetical protein
MRIRRLAPILLAAAVAIAFYAAPAAQSKPDRLKTILAQMDAGSARFHSAEADIKKEHLEKVVNDVTTDTGTMYFLRSGGAIQVGAKFNPPDAKVLEYKDGRGRLYTVGTNHLDQFTTGCDNQARFETYIALGFGGTGTALSKAWEITDDGPEQMNDGAKSVQVEKLDLISKDPSARKNYSHVTIWLDPERDVTLKQIFFAPSGDTDSATYTNIRLNQPIDQKAYAIKCQGKCS